MKRWLSAIVLAALLAAALGFTSPAVVSLHPPRATALAASAARNSRVPLIPESLWKRRKTPAAPAPNAASNWAPLNALRALRNSVAGLAARAKQQVSKLFSRRAAPVPKKPAVSALPLVKLASKAVAGVASDARRIALSRNALAALVAHVFVEFGLPALQQKAPQLEKVRQYMQEHLGGVSAGFAAVAVRDLATNLAGRAMLQVTNPFQVGDQVSVKHAGQLIDGTIVERGLYYTTVQSRDTTPHYVPNSAFLSASVSNLSRVSYQYCETQLVLPLSFGDKAASITAAIKARLSQLPNVSRGKPITASVTALGPNSLTVQASCYLRKTKRSARDLQQLFLLEVLDAARQQGAALLASPTTPSQAQ